MAPEKAVTFTQCATTQILEVARMVEQPSAAASADPVAEDRPRTSKRHPATTRTTLKLSLPCPARVPAAIKAASPGPGMPAPMTATSTNNPMYSPITLGT